ncbi:MAG: metallophosphoesterase [Clostridia bacterium]|nr:metallophosphoesterase [Clostridia bacterium]
MRITVFSDLHAGEAVLTCGDRYPSLSFSKLERIVADAKNAGSELLLCLGDITDGASADEAARSLLRVAEIISDSGLPFLCLPGNHDLYTMNDADFIRFSGFKTPDPVMKLGGVTAMFLDACYSVKMSGGGDAPGEAGCEENNTVRYFADGNKPDWKNSVLPEERLIRLESDLGKLPDGAAVYVFSHQLIMPGGEARHMIRNAEIIRAVLERHSERLDIKSVCGHYHPGGHTVSHGIEYTVLPAVCTGCDFSPCSVKNIEL